MNKFGSPKWASPSSLTFYPFFLTMSDFDFDGFIEADDNQSTTAKTITDNFPTDPAFKPRDVQESFFLNWATKGK